VAALPSSLALLCIPQPLTSFALEFIARGHGACGNIQEKTNNSIGFNEGEFL